MIPAFIKFLSDYSTVTSHTEERAFPSWAIIFRFSWICDYARRWWNHPWTLLAILTKMSTHYPGRKERGSQTKHEWLESQSQIVVDLLKHAGTLAQKPFHVCFESHATFCQDDTCSAHQFLWCSSVVVWKGRRSRSATSCRNEGEWKGNIGQVFAFLSIQSLASRTEDTLCEGLCCSWPLWQCAMDQDLAVSSNRVPAREMELNLAGSRSKWCVEGLLSGCNQRGTSTRNMRRCGWGLNITVLSQYCNSFT